MRERGEREVIERCKERDVERERWWGDRDGDKAGEGERGRELEIRTA